MLEAAKNHKVKRVIYSASSSVYGGAAKLPTKESENPPNPKSPYGLQKYVGESFCKVFSELYCSGIIIQERVAKRGTLLICWTKAREHAGDAARLELDSGVSGVHGSQPLTRERWAQSR